MGKATAVSDIERAEHLNYADGAGVKRVSIYNDGVQIKAATKENQDTIISNQTNGSQTTSLVDPSDATRKGEFDTYFKAPVVVDASHHEVHEGRSFNYCDRITLANAATQYYLITTPDTTRLSHFGYIINFLDGAGTLDIFEATDRVGTTLQTSYNRNRTSANTAGTTIHKSISGGTTDGTNICMRGGGTNQTLAVVVGSGGERVLKSNTKYLMKITNLTALNNNVNIEFDWYEHISE